jgi:thioredoxin-related protein
MLLFRALPLWLSLLTLLSCAEAREPVPPLQDLRAEAAASRQSGRPIVLFFHSRTCPYCRLVEEDYLHWVMVDNARHPRILLRAVDIDSDAKLIVLDGGVTTPRAYARAQGVQLVPHLKFTGPAGETLSADLIGVSIPDFYAGYLDEAIRESVEKLRKR